MALATTLLARNGVAERTGAFHFARPQGFDFVPGQAVELLLPGPGGQPQGHAFSIVSAPSEREVVVATRLRDSAYKRALDALQPGAAAELDGPVGELTLDDAARPAVLIAGGIGITPFVSMLRDARERGVATPLALVYSNRRPQDAAYLAELQALAGTHPWFRLHATMTGHGVAGAWAGRTGHIDAGMLGEAAQGLSTPRWYVAGPPGLVAAATMALDDLGVPARDVLSETFEGYE
jgi:ferredoxin-NADP reductase